jgi:hypothetical protein
MFSLRRLTTSLTKSLQRPVMMPFSDTWKERDEASEKVYISQAESTSQNNFRINHQETFEKGGGGTARVGVQHGVISKKAHPNNASL